MSQLSKRNDIFYELGSYVNREICLWITIVDLERPCRGRWTRFNYCCRILSDSYRILYKGNGGGVYLFATPLLRVKIFLSIKVVGLYNTSQIFFRILKVEEIVEEMSAVPKLSGTPCICAYVGTTDVNDFIEENTKDKLDKRENRYILILRRNGTGQRPNASILHTAKMVNNDLENKKRGRLIDPHPNLKKQNMFPLGVSFKKSCPAHFLYLFIFNFSFIRYRNVQFSTFIVPI